MTNEISGEEQYQPKKKQVEKIKILFLLSVAQLFGLSLWFAPNAVLDQLIPIFSLKNYQLSQLNIVVIIGFVLGGLISSITNISDIIRTKYVFFWSTLLGGMANFLTIFMTDFLFVLILRFFTGIFLAGIYPVGMKLTSSHFKQNRGFAIGILLSALTVGSGLPYLFLLFGSPDWTVLISVVSGIDIFGGILILLFVDEGPYLGKSTQFDLSAVKTIYQRKSVRLANYAYFGHMWELYAFWAWFPIMLRSSFEFSSHFNQEETIRFFGIGSFAIFVFGGIATASGGYIADTIGRSTFNIVMLSISGTSALIIGFMYPNPILVLIIGIIWGIAIIPDSPQYSTIVTEVSNQNLVGSALTIQTAIGFSITIISISLVPVIQNIIGWRYAFMFLSIGPVIGIISSYLIRKEPDAYRIANGKM